MAKNDSRFVPTDDFEAGYGAETSRQGVLASEMDSQKQTAYNAQSDGHDIDSADNEGEGEGVDGVEVDGLVEGMDREGFVGPKVVKPLTPEALAAYQAAQNRTGVIYISRIPPAMRPTKVRHIMSQYGEVGRVYLQQEDAKRAYLRKKYTSTKKAHYTEGWVEFKDKKIARSVAELLNAQPVGGKKGTRFRDDIWTMKYLPKFKWYMLTEQVAHESATRAARLRLELSQSKTEQREYLKNVELARVLDKRAERKRVAGKEMVFKPRPDAREKHDAGEGTTDSQPRKRRKRDDADQQGKQLDSVLSSIF